MSEQTEAVEVPAVRLRVWRLKDGKPVLDEYLTQYGLRDRSDLFYALIGNAVSEKPGLTIETTGAVPFISLLEPQP